MTRCLPDSRQIILEIGDQFNCYWYYTHYQTSTFESQRVIWSLSTPNQTLRWSPVVNHPALEIRTMNDCNRIYRNTYTHTPSTTYPGENNGDETIKLSCQEVECARVCYVYNRAGGTLVCIWQFVHSPNVARMCGEMLYCSY